MAELGEGGHRPLPAGVGRPVGDPWLGEVVDDEGEIRQAARALQRGGQLRLPDEQVVDEPGFGHCLQPRQHVIASGRRSPRRRSFVDGWWATSPGGAGREATSSRQCSPVLRAVSRHASDV